jgi:hypothetical protein
MDMFNLVRKNLKENFTRFYLKSYVCATSRLYERNGARMFVRKPPEYVKNILATAV